MKSENLKCFINSISVFNICLLNVEETCRRGENLLHLHSKSLNKNKPKIRQKDCYKKTSSAKDKKYMKDCKKYDGPNPMLKKPPVLKIKNI